MPNSGPKVAVRYLSLIGIDISPYHEMIEPSTEAAI